MGTVKLDNLRSVRRALGKSQSEMAELLGISARAVQSYEQGWRDIPPYVQKLAGLLLCWAWRKRQGKPDPCWKVRKCEPVKREECTAYQLAAGDYCWIATGNYCRGQKQDSWQAKLAYCQKCTVMKRWLTV